MNEYKGKRVVVMGLGVNQGGLGVSKWLLKHGAKLTVTDLKDRRSLGESIAALESERKRLRAPAIRYVLGRHRDSDFRGADVVIQNPGVPRESKHLAIARKAGARIETDISIFFRLCPHPVTAVSGTKGKTTTAMLAAAMLKEQFGKVVVGGNLGKSVLDSLDHLMREKHAPPIVFELSSWHLEGLPSIKKGPHVAALTNILPDHLNRYRDMDDYASAKEQIFVHQKKGDIAVVPHDNTYTRAMGHRVTSERIWASMKFFECDENILAYRRDARAVIRRAGVETELFRKSDVKLPGEHSLWNALLAAGLAFLSGAKPPVIRRTLRTFQGVPHRLEHVRDLGGISYWNDSAATMPDASVAAMRALGGRGRKRIILIAGGSDKNLYFKDWAREVKRYAKDIILFDGSATPKVILALRKSGVRPGEIVRSMRDALHHARASAKRGDVVLLSPGCSSFGLFTNEFDRGNQFRTLVKNLR